MESVEDEWKRFPESQEDLDLLFVAYDAGIITVERLQEEIKKQGFEPEVREPDELPDRPSEQEN